MSKESIYSHDAYNTCVSENVTQPATPDLTKLEHNLGCTFNDVSLLTHALYHSSYVNESQDENIKKTGDNQRFEFLGDAVLGLAIGHLLMEKYPDMHEGGLSKLRAALVSESGLASMAKSVDLGNFIFLGKGETLSKGSEKDSILADTFEAVMAAIYLDKGFNETCALVNRLFSSMLHTAMNGSETDDYKSMLQERAQEMGNCTPQYTILNESGPDHDKTFEIIVNACNIESKGMGKSKKAAEQNGAKNALKILKDL